MIQIGNIEIADYPVMLAPMEDISDPPFRRICRFYGADLVYTEFISSDALARKVAGSIHKAEVLPEDHPVAIQIFGHNPDSMKQAAEIVTLLQPDIIDLNFGCPVKKVVSKGAGAALLKDIPAMIKITEAVVKSTHLPVTVKTRLGWDEKNIVIEDLAERLQDAGIAALAIHARTAKQMYKGKADWEWIGKVKNNPRIKIPIFGNGDINDPFRAKEVKDKYAVDGILIGRASIGNPWIFRNIKHYLATDNILKEPKISEKVDVCKKHLSDSILWKGERLAILEIRKHYGHYFRELPHFKSYKISLVEQTNPDEIFNILDEIKENYKI